MKSTLYLLIIGFLVSGCNTFESYYTNPNKPGYTVSHFSASCKVCSRTYSFSQEQLDTHDDINCPYCGTTQNILQAHRRYTYDTKQARKENFVTFQERKEERKRKREEAGNSRLNPIYVERVY